MNSLVQLTREGAVGVITIHNPPVNALSPGVPEGILACVEAIVADGKLRAAVLIGSGRTFIAGADIKEFGKITSGERTRGVGLNPILEQIENAAKPVVAAIHGTAFGGGLEVAMACHYRVAVAGAQVGQPEVKLGLIPGAGGTQRLPRLVGSAKAAELCAFGEPISAQVAFDLGLVDCIADGDLLRNTRKTELPAANLSPVFLRDLVARQAPFALLSGAVAFAMTLAAPRRTSGLTAKLAEFDRDSLTKKVTQKLRGRQAPLRAIDAVAAAARMSFEEGLAEEARLFQECLYSDESKSLIHAFFGEREVSKVPGIAGKSDFAVRKAAIIGAGTMGGGITMNYVNAGIPVLLKETTQEALDKGMATIRRNYESTVAKGRLSREEAERRLALITPALSYDGFEDADIVVEAVFEGLDLKKKIFTEIDAVARPGAILASNTSTLSIDEIASATKRPQDVIGHHYFSPANVMRLLEIVRGKASSPEVIGASLAIGKKLGKVAVVVGNCRGFVGNRMFHPYRREAQFLVEEGASIPEVDEVLYEFGMAMGPLSVGDLAGLDVGWRIRKEFKHLEKPGIRQPLVEDQLCEMGRFGQKTRAGWYQYDEQRNRLPDKAVEALVRQAARDAGIERRNVSREEILDRCIYGLVNEGARILEEGIALRSVDIDIIYLNGYGFPAHRGGPMFYADTVGLDKVYARICEFERAHGELWTPAPLLKRLALEGKRFADFQPE
ncbi:MAG: enoyl-CoA hydratase/isomerase family protein [Acidobacteriia bacterium]|nr:enoyl-CoA hydratase/isomerase family protein [Terriglobia bacterium]